MGWGSTCLRYMNSIVARKKDLSQSNAHSVCLENNLT